jgi:nicotinamidase-related amidase
MKFGFGSKYLLMEIDDEPYAEIALIGLCTDICVITNALTIKGTYPEMTVRVVADACAGTTPEMHRKALDVMRSCHIEVV